MIRRILADNIIDYITKVNITKFKKVLIACFYIFAIISMIEIVNLILQSIKQKKDKDFC